MKNKNAFTLAELLVCFGIVGIISVMALYTLMKYDKGIRFLYSNTFYQLDRAYYNGFNFSEVQNPFAEDELDNEGNVIGPMTPEKGAHYLCLMMSEYLNGGGACSAGGLADQTGRNFGSVQFQTDHGALIYISKRLPEENNPNFNPGDHQYFLVYVDINGPERPNSMEYIPATPDNPDQTDPDIFAFAALDTGRLCPLGPPEVDPRYMQARIGYIAESRNDTESVLIKKYSTVSTPYYIAKAQAWGYYLPDSDDFSPIDDEPTSYNDYIRRTLPDDNEIYKFMDGAERIELPQEFPGMRADFRCEPRYNEQCWVIVDRYLW